MSPIARVFFDRAGKPNADVPKSTAAKKKNLTPDKRRKIAGQLR